MLNRRLLDSKMALKGCTQRSLAKYLKKSEVSINKKFQGILKFSVDEINQWWSSRNLYKRIRRQGKWYKRTS